MYIPFSMGDLGGLTCKFNLAFNVSAIDVRLLSGFSLFFFVDLFLSFFFVFGLSLLIRDLFLLFDINDSSLFFDDVS